MKLNLIIIFLITLFSVCRGQIQSSFSLNEIDSLVAHIDSLLNSDSCHLRVFTKNIETEIPIEVFDFENWGEDIIETYNIIYDAKKTPIIFISFPYSESGDWTLSHSYYFGSNGKTYYYKFYLGAFNSICTELLRKYIGIYFNNNFDIIIKTVRYEDKDFNVLNEIEDCNPYYNFEVEYKGYNNFESIISKYKIKL